MSKLNDLLARAKQRAKNVPEWSFDDLMQLREKDSLDISKKRNSERKEQGFKNNFSRSGILPLHEKCTIHNYLTKCPGQNKALNFSCDYIDRFHSSGGKGFIFSGGTGTGKNHLAAAICNKLMTYGKSCLLITVSELMMELRKCYGNSAEMKEDVFIKKMLSFDLLIIDEIGLQRGSDNEKIIINLIIDGRVCRLKPTGILTNCTGDELNNILGQRIMSRMKSNNGEWISFNWPDYRK